MKQLVTLLVLAVIGLSGCFYDRDHDRRDGDRYERHHDGDHRDRDYRDRHDYDDDHYHR